MMQTVVNGKPITECRVSDLVQVISLPLEFDGDVTTGFDPEITRAIAQKLLQEKLS